MSAPFMRGNLRPGLTMPQVSSEPVVTPRDRIRDNLATRCAELEGSCPEALDVTADFLAELHGRIAGRASALCGNRNPVFFREQLLGIRALTSDDMGRLSIQAPTAMGPALDRLARPAGHRVVADDVPGPDSLAEALAQVQEIAGMFFAIATRALDGKLSKDDVEREAAGVERKWAAFRVSLGRRVA